MIAGGTQFDKIFLNFFYNGCWNNYKYWINYCIATLNCEEEAHCRRIELKFGIPRIDNLSTKNAFA